MLENKAARIKTQNPASAAIKPYFERAKEILFDSEQPQRVIERIWDDDLTLGVCAKPLKAGDVAWKCEDCELDPTCIICLDCFNNSDHEGHRTWLKTNVSGCCDCGDPEGWNMNGACTKHKGIDSSKDKALDALPDTIRARSPEVMIALTKILKQLLLIVLKKSGKDWEANKEKRVAEAMISEFFDEATKLLQSWKQCIFFLSEAYLEVFPGAFILTQESEHECCYRYFPDDEFREKYQEQVAIYESTMEDTNAAPKYCTCTVVDLLFMADQRFNPLQKLNKKISQQCVHLFQSYNFKQHLCFGYVANMPKFLSHGGNARGISQLGVQILTMDSVTQRIFRDEKLSRMPATTLKTFLEQLIWENGSDNGTFYQCRFIRYDLKYIAKPNLMPQLVQSTNMLEDLVDAVQGLHFADVQTNSTQMAEFGDNTVQYLFLYASLDQELISVIESKYLSHVTTRNVDCARLIKFFQEKFQSLYQNHLTKHHDKGTFLMPLHRSFTFVLTRMLMKHYTLNQLSETGDEDEASLPPTNFHNYLLEQLDGLFENGNQIQIMLEQALFSVAKQMGFIAEIDANKWVYKGQRFKILSQIEHDAYYEKYLRMIGLFQVSICASAQKSRCIDMLLNNFGTDDWLAVYYMSLAHPTGPCLEMYDGLPNFAVEKLTTQVQLLFQKLIEIAITEASFLLPSKKKLLNNKNEAKAAKRMEKMLGAHLRREMMHVLFSQGANSTIDQIKKASHSQYLKSDQFTQAVIDLSTSQTDSSGKKQFRLNAKGKHEAMFDPYYIVKKKQESATQTAYDQFYKNNASCNNIVGDYLGHYKYQTAVNRECHQAMAQSNLLTEVVCQTIKQCLNVWLDGRNDGKDDATQPQVSAEAKAFKQELFPQQTLFMGLKLLLIISQQTGEGGCAENMATIQQVLPSKLLTEAFNLEACKDKKLSEIGLYIKSLIHKEDQSMAAEDAEKSQVIAKSHQEAQVAKKVLQNKKKAAMLAKMKKKQSNFILPKAKSETVQASKDQDTMMTQQPMEQSAFQLDEPCEQNGADFGQSCASCQEPLELNKFYERPFAQLCYLSQTKLLYYTYQQTVQSQRQSLKNLHDAQDFTRMPEQYIPSVNPIEEEKMEECKETISSHSQSEVSGAKVENSAMFEDQHTEWNKLVMQDLQLTDVIDEKYKTGVSFQKCCHAFHLDCLQQYQTADGEMNFQRIYMKQLVGQDDGCIQCPMCKTFKNTWQPFLPLGLDQQVANETDDTRKSPNRINPYIDFCSQLIVNHFNCFQSWNDADEHRNLPKSFMAVDIQREPETFILRMCSVITHLVLESTCLTNTSLLMPFSASSQQNGVVLRDFVYTMLTVREILHRLTEPEKLQELAELMLSSLASDIYEQNSLKLNLPKLIVRFLFISGVLLPVTDLSKVKEATIQSLHVTLQAQLAVADAFRKGYGQLVRGQVWPKVQEAKEQMKAESQSESLIESQLSFLRAAAAMSLSIDALVQCQTQGFASFTSAEAMQLNLDQDMMDQLREQTDDQAEFNLLLNHLGLSSSLSSDEPKALADFRLQANDSKAVSMISVLYYSILNLSGLHTTFQQTVMNLAQQAVSINLPQISDEVMEGAEDDMIGMPNNLHLLTTYFTFNLIELPPDFHHLVKQYYTRQCRGCRKQLQESAICLLCGDILCAIQSAATKCCEDRPGMKMLVERREGRQNFFANSSSMEIEGELSWHARHCEGGNAIFLIPQSATIFMIDQGRIIRGESPYRNALGETFSQKSAKWDNYLLSEETGGAQVMRTLRKNYLEHKVPQIILTGRQAGERVILRHVY